MRADLTSKPSFNSSPSSFPFSFHPKPFSRKPSSSIRILNSISEKPQEDLRKASKFGNPDPPRWLFLPPPPPINPFSSERLPFDFQLNRSATEIPFSIRLLRARKKSLARRNPETSADLGSIGKAVWSLACILEELQKSAISDEKILARVSTDTGDSIVWLFQRVFSTSPNLVIGLLVLTADFMLLSVERSIPKAILSPGFLARNWRLGAPEIGEYGCWSDIGILHESDKTLMVLDDGLPDYKRRRMAYEQMIVTEENPNSLILSNYAQLLYHYEKDLDSANNYFLWAVKAEPADGEAMSRYAKFLWHARGDIDQAEEMFLEAIEADPKNSYHRSSYAWFLWMTGGTDTCYPVDHYDLTELEL